MLSLARADLPQPHLPLLPSYFGDAGRILGLVEPPLTSPAAEP